MQKSSDANLQWEDIRYFLELTRAGSLSGAARALAVEHSTVARRVESLEKTLGLRLFDRLPRGWQLTAEGEDVVGLAEQMEANVFAFERAAIGAGAERGKVRVSAPPSLVSQFLVPRLAAMRPRWSSIALELVGELHEVNLARREADLALRLGRPSEPSLVAKCLGPIGFGLYAQANYPSRQPEEWEFIGFDESLRHVPQQQWLEAYAEQRPFSMRSNSQTALQAAARAGLGVACLPHYLAKLDPELVSIATPTPAPTRELWLVLQADVRRSPRVRAIADVLTEIVLADAALLAG